jgi:CRP/FNR family transcriptional regulator, anaerobic regulatory protein
MYPQLLQRLNHLSPLNPKQQRDLSQAVQELELPKASLILEEGDVSNHIYFVVKGGLRSSYTVDGKEVTRWLCFEGHFASSYFSFAYRTPSEDRIITISDCTLLCLSYDSLQSLCRQDPVWIDLNQRLLGLYYTALLARIASFQTQSTAERYRALLQEYPDIEERVALSHIASYLGMTQETLSRLRAQFKRRQNRDREQC